MSTTEALRIQDLRVELSSGRAARPVLAGVDLVVHKGETVALGMLPDRATVTGQVLVDGQDILAVDKKQLRQMRSHQVAMIYQDPRAGINPVRRVRQFLVEGLVASGTDKKAALARCASLLESVGIRDTATVLEQYPHQLSGGMLQRIMIAAALSSEPSLLLADEPTTALDVTTQAEVVSILDQRRADTDAAMLFVTHDLDLAAAICKRIYVMYAGRIVEHQRTEDLFAAPRHPYTRALLASTPSIEAGHTMEAVPGRALSLDESTPGCSFAPRCVYAEDTCLDGPPALRRVMAADVACVRAEEMSVR